MRRAQLYQTHLVEHLGAGDPPVLARLKAMEESFVAHGSTLPDAMHRAEALLISTVSRQAAMMG